MSRLVVTNQSSKPSTPAAGKSAVYATTTTPELAILDSNGISMVPIRVNSNTADVTASAADTYLTGSGFTFPSGLTKLGMLFKWVFFMSKTGAGTATPIWNVRVGTGGIVTDAGRITFTGVAQTANVDTGMAEIIAVVRSIGATGVMQGGYIINKNLNSATTGFTNTATPNVQQVVSAGFDMTIANSIVGVSCNPGASGVWTFQMVQAQCHNFTL